MRVTTAGQTNRIITRLQTAAQQLEAAQPSRHLGPARSRRSATTRRWARP
jgi:hypothetical protein